MASARPTTRTPWSCMTSASMTVGAAKTPIPCLPKSFIRALSSNSATIRGRMSWDWIKLRLPFIGGIFHRFALMQFTQSLGTLLAGGTPMVPALEIASQSITNQVVATRVAGIVQNVREGETLWRSLEHTGVISDLAVEMIKVGESTGALTEMLGNVSEFYDEEIEARLSRVVTAIEPIILVLMGGVIAVLLYAFYLPLFELSNVGSQ